jgi:divalent metal cation (Fe/Co/Zn/Cd) transporter
MRSGDVASAIRWCAASLAWAGLVGAATIAAGLSAGSTALVGFGLNSLVDGGASATLVWRFRRELHGLGHSHELEARAARVIGALLALIALYLIVRASIALADHSGPSGSPLGLALSGASIAVLPVLGLNKLRLARSLASQALRADGVLSVAGAALAAAALIGLVLSTGLDLWWADSVAALLIALALVRESVVTLRASRKPQRPPG